MAAQDKENGEEEALLDANVHRLLRHLVLKRLSPPWLIGQPINTCFKKKFEKMFFFISFIIIIIKLEIILIPNFCFEFF